MELAGIIILSLVLFAVGIAAILLADGKLRVVATILIGLFSLVMIAGLVIKIADTIKINGIKKEYDITDDFSYSCQGEDDEYYRIQMNSFTDSAYLLVPKTNAEMDPMPSFSIPVIVFCEKGQSYYGIPVENDKVEINGQTYYVDHIIRRMVPDYGALGLLITVIGSVFCVPINAVMLIKAVGSRAKSRMMPKI